MPGENFAITNHKFTMEFYDNGMPSLYATDASIIVDGQEVLRRTIEVNKPLSYGGWEIYQASWREEPRRGAPADGRGRHREGAHHDPV